LKNENGCLKLLISDDGIGFDSGDIAQKKSLGLIMMRERATSIGATLTVISQPGQGTSFLLSKQINE
jgi:signal transduction histidine kinase